MQMKSYKELTSMRPVYRSALRIYFEKKYFRFKRYIKWLTDDKQYAKSADSNLLLYVVFAHETPLLRQLSNVDSGFRLSTQRRRGFNCKFM
jgi:vancomycin resistance protein VanW